MSGGAAYRAIDIAGSDTAPTAALCAAHGSAAQHAAPGRAFAAMRVREDIGAIAFDLDGTLVDSAPDIAHALNICSRVGGPGRFWIAPGARLGR